MGGREQEIYLDILGLMGTREDKQRILDAVLVEKIFKNKAHRIDTFAQCFEAGKFGK